MPRVTRPIPDPTDSEDIDHDQTQGGDEGTPHDHANPGDTQPPEEHGNTAHTETFAVDGDEQPPEVHGDTEHDDTVPSQSDLEEEISFEVFGNVDNPEDLPDPAGFDTPTIGYIESGELAGDYIGLVQE